MADGAESPRRPEEPQRGSTPVDGVEPAAFAPADGDVAASDDALVARVAAGEAEALGQIHDRHGRAAYSLARRICVDERIAAEAVQESLLTLWRDPQRHDPAHGRFAGWLLTLVRHQAFDAARRAGVGGRALPGADRAVRAGDTGHAERALAGLSEEQRAALTLTLLGGYTQREVAAITRAPLGAVESRTFNAVLGVSRSLASARSAQATEAASRWACPQVQLAVALALHALEPADETTVAAHLPGCPYCQDVVRRTQEVVLGLAAGAEQVDPPAGARTVLVRAAAGTTQLPPERRTRPWLSARSATPPPPSPAPSRVRPPASGLGASRPWSAGAPPHRHRWIAVLATVAVALAGVGAVVLQIADLRGGNDTSVAAPPEVTGTLSELDRAGARPAVLRSARGNPVAVVALSQGQWQVMPFAMAPNPEGVTYQLWGIGDGPPVALGAFDVTEPSATLLPVGSSGQADQYPGYGISIEKRRTAPTVPGIVVASGQVAN